MSLNFLNILEELSAGQFPSPTAMRHASLFEYDDAEVFPRPSQSRLRMGVSFSRDLDFIGQLRPILQVLSQELLRLLEGCLLAVHIASPDHLRGSTRRAIQRQFLHARR
jgi:hypothetical protein